ncbi:2-hydroxyacid dehydrogenase [Candidiatus Paracoxiella cheracis]|uniref:2-hydroxyacid dehydrogenase n=1 Tax=Candidiatus Paracoxiella cheracis TaxID=3405120 RepID=UPI003BF6181B
MKVAIFSVQSYERPFFEKANHSQHELVFIEEPLSLSTVSHAQSCEAVCCFVLDDLNADVLKALAKERVKLVALRSAGYDHVDLKATDALGLTVVNVPEYSPPAVAEFAVALILTLSRKLRQSFQRVAEQDFSLTKDILGFNLHEKIVGVVGTGRIGCAFASIMHGFGCDLLGYDPYPNDDCKKLGMTYVSLDELLNKSDIISLNCLLNEKTFHMIDEEALSKTKKGAMLINTGRGGLVDTAALIKSLENDHLGYAGLDVYEKEKGLFFVNHTGKIIQDEQFVKLENLSTVVITPHEAFFTEEAVANITKMTIENLSAFEQGHVINQIRS